MPRGEFKHRYWFFADTYYKVLILTVFSNIREDGQYHKVLIYIEHHSVCPLVRIGTPPPL
jgi:hypothetical protein